MASPSAHALVSIKLNDVIKSNGIGNIDLLTPSSNMHIITSVMLEEFRQNNGGDMVFAVDVNEAASGSEKASTQAVTIESAELIFIINGNEFRFNQFSTRTNSMLAKSGTTQRSLYSTLLGNTGSNRITTNSESDLNGSSFDSTINFTVNLDISQATSAVLSINFLDTNTSLGDPEAFYDFSNGFEDIAIVTAEDALYLDQLKSGFEGAPLVLPEDTISTPDGGTAYYPSQSGYYLAAYEDLFPYLGDYDFNDLVVGYNVAAQLDSNGRVRGLAAEGYLIARGAGYSHDWHLRIALPPSVSGTGELKLFLPGEADVADGYPVAFTVLDDIDVTVYSHTRILWLDSAHEGVNTLIEQTLLQGHRFTFNVIFDAPIDITDLNAPFDPYLYVRDTQFEIHLEGKNPVLSYSRNIAEGKTSFLDSNNYPFAQVFPDTWQVPLERVDLGSSYPDFINFINSGKSQNIKWYNAADSSRVKAISPSHWKW